MGISLSPFQPGAVNNQGGAPDALAQLLAALSQGADIGVRGVEESGRNSRSSAENEIQKARLDFQKTQETTRQLELKHQTELLKQEGAGYQALLGYLGPRGEAGPIAAQMQQRLMQGGGSTSSPQQQFGPPSAPPAQEAQTPQSPLDMLRMVTQGMDPEALAAFSRNPQVAALVNDAQKRQDQEAAMRARQATLTRTLNGIADPAQRRGAEALANWDAISVTLPEAVQRGLYPELFAIEGWTPDAVTKVFGQMEKSKLTLGAVRKAQGLPPNPSLPDSFRLPTSADQATETQRKAANFLEQAVAADLDIQRVGATEGGLALSGDVLRGQSGAGILDAITRYASQESTSPAQKQLVQANIAFTQAARFFMSGQQSALGERGDFILQYVGFKTEDAETRAQKAASRAVLLAGMERVADGVSSRKQVIERLLANPMLTKKQKDWIRENAVMDERKFEQAASGLKNPVP